jgi:glycosyltransferase Alg8
MGVAVKTLLLSTPAILFWLLTIVVLLLALPGQAWQLKSEAVIVLGIIGIWRYSWWLSNVLRGIAYRWFVFPRLRQLCDSLRSPYPQRLFVMVLSYKENPDISAKVFAALTRELMQLPMDATLVVSVAEENEARYIRYIVDSIDKASSVKLIFMKQNQGKRVAMGHALRRIARDFNDPGHWTTASKDDLVIFMDGDSLITPGTIKRTLGFFKLDPRLGGLTTHEDAIVQNGSLLATEWYKLRFVRRHAMMKSHALSSKVLTLTGRFSIFRAPIVLSEQFIRGVEADYLNHWLFGRFRFLMGDDKSTWYHLLKEKWNMLYVPDVLIYSMESRIDSFFTLTIPLVFRWNGNMLRNNARALKLGPGRVGWYIWFAILDQRVSMWTTFIGPITAAMLVFQKSWVMAVFYLMWVIMTRLLQLIVLAFNGKKLTVIDLPLQVYDQWVGSSVKIYASYHLNQQSWSKAKSRSPSTTHSKIKLSTHNLASRVIMLVHITIVMTILAMGVGVLKLPHSVSIHVL